MEENKDLFKWYKNKITQNTQDPPEDAWQNISDELDINDVWQKVAAKLDNSVRWYQQKSLYYAASALLLLFLLSGGIYLHMEKNGDLVLAENTQVDHKLTPQDTQSIATAPLPLPADEDKGVEEKEATQPRLSSDQRVSPAATNSSLQGSKHSPLSEVPNPVTENKTLDEKHSDQDPVVTDKNADQPASIVSESSGNEVGANENTAEEGRTITLNENGIERPAMPRQGSIHIKLQETSHRDTNNASENNDSRDEDISDGIIQNNTRRPAIASGVRTFIQPVLLPDSMLTISPIVVMLHPDSLEKISVKDREGKLMYARTLEFGLTASLKNTWLLNRTTFSGLEKHTLNTTLPDFGKDLGMVICYNFAPRFSVQTEGMFVSDMGQRYKEYRNGKYVERNIDLQYYTLNVLLKYSKNKVVYGKPVNNHGFIGGLYSGVLNKATQTINAQEMDVRVNYSDFDFGMIFGYEYNRYLFSNLVLTSGFRVNYGFPDIDANSWSKTATGSFDVNIALKYRFGF